MSKGIKSKTALSFEALIRNKIGKSLTTTFFILEKTIEFVEPINYDLFSVMLDAIGFLKKSNRKHKMPHDALLARLMSIVNLIPDAAIAEFAKQYSHIYGDFFQDNSNNIFNNKGATVLNQGNFNIESQTFNF